MKPVTDRKKIRLRQEELQRLRQRLAETWSKLGDAFSLGGDGWHDNSAYDLLNAEVDKICSLMDEVREEIAQLRKKLWVKEFKTVGKKPALPSKFMLKRPARAVMVHGTKTNREANWFPWLAGNFLNLGILSSVQSFPHRLVKRLTVGLRFGVGKFSNLIEIQFSLVTVVPPPLFSEF